MFFWLVIIFILGSAVGSFLNVDVIFRQGRYRGGRLFSAL